MPQNTLPPGRRGAEAQMRYRDLDTVGTEKIGPPWQQDETSGNLFPNEINSATPGVGTASNPVNHVSIGSAGDEGAEGYLTQRMALDGGGVSLIGYKGYDPDNPAVRPVRGNAYLELNGNAVLVATGGLWIEIQDQITEDHECIFGPSATLSDGRHFAPLLLGQKKVYAYTESAEDALDYDVLDVGEVEVVSMTLVNAYAKDVSTFGFSVVLDNPGGKNTRFITILKLDGTEMQRYSRTVNGNSITLNDSVTLGNDVSAGQVISLDVEAIGSHGQSQGWVRGTDTPTRIEIKQG